MENKSLGMIIREERKKKGLTQAQLGKLIGLKESRVSKIDCHYGRWESGSVTVHLQPIKMPQRC